MEYKPDFEELEPYYRAFWQCEVLDRPAISITAPKKGSTQAECPWKNEKQRFYQGNIEPVVDYHESVFRNTFYGGLAAPHFGPEYGPDIFSGFLRVVIKFSEDSEVTSWAEWKDAPLRDYDDLSILELDRNTPLYRKYLEATRLGIKRGAGRYLVSAIDLHGGFDSLAVLRGGPDQAALDLLENPAGVKKAMAKLYRVWEEIYDDYCAIVRDSQAGTSSWMNIWAPGKMFPVQNDFSCLVSGKMYREFFLEELVAEIDHLDYSIYHLDGTEALQHLDILLDIPKLSAIQWVSGAKYSGAGIERWIPLFQKIQARKKAIVVYPSLKEIPLVLEKLKPEGLLVQVGCGSEEEARQVLAKYGWKQPAR